MKDRAINKTKFFIASLASAYFLYYALSYTDWHFIDSANLFIHEAGHFIFMPLGRFMELLGGSLAQVLLPAVFVIYFYGQQQYFSASLVLFWVGQNIINVSVYASDAIFMRLPLIGGPDVLHDWNNILQMLGILEYTKIIGVGIYILGLIVILSAIYSSFYYSLSRNTPLSL